jgi:hypothetical protein
MTSHTDSIIASPKWVKIDEDELKTLVASQTITRIKFKGRDKRSDLSDFGISIRSKTWFDFSVIIDSDDLKMDEWSIPFDLAIYKQVVTHK